MQVYNTPVQRYTGYISVSAKDIAYFTLNVYSVQMYSGAPTSSSGSHAPISDGLGFKCQPGQSD
jgi:hypothetical protein